MSLLKPTPGEICDRLSILTLKVSAYCASKKDNSALKQEESELDAYMKSTYPLRPRDEANLLAKLMSANSKLWEAEDLIRYGDNQDSYRVARVARDIARLNDERNRLIREIDKAYGCENPVEEKIYSCTVQK